MGEADKSASLSTKADPVEMSVLDEAAEHVDTNKEVKGFGGIGAAYQKAETQQAKQFLAYNAQKEKRLIQSAQKRESKMEAAAKKVLVKDVKKIEKDQQD